jgi:DNA-binding MarR family transcriptional regulator
VLALRFLHNQENYQATHTSLKKFLHLNPSTVTGIIQRLEKKALVAGIAHPTDKRITFWTLTAKASILLQKMPPLLHDRLSGKLENLPALERNNILQNLEKIVTLLNIEQIEAAPYFVSNEILA